MVKLIYLDGEAYQLVRQIKENLVKDNMEGLKAWRDMLHCDHVLKYQGSYLMVRRVTDAEVVEEEEWDEDHALDLVMNDMVKDLTEEDLKEVSETVGD